MRTKKNNRRGKPRVRLKCPRCGHIWDYSGKHGIGKKVSCPNCYTTLRIDNKSIIKTYDPKLTVELEKSPEKIQNVDVELGEGGEVSRSKVKGRGKPTENSITAEIYKTLVESGPFSPELNDTLERVLREVLYRKLAEEASKEIFQRYTSENGEKGNERSAESEDTITLYFQGQEVKVTVDQFLMILQNPVTRRLFGLEETGGSLKDEEKIPWTDPDTGVTVKLSPETYALLQLLLRRNKESESELVDWVNPSDGKVLKVPKNMVVPLTIIAMQARKSTEPSEREKALWERIKELERRNHELMQEMRARQIAREIGEYIARNLGGILKEIQDMIREIRLEIEELQREQNL